MPPKKKQDPAAKIKACFAAADANGDGFITRLELEVVFRRLPGGCDWTDEEFDLLFQSADANGDDKLSYDEFVDWLTGARVEPPAAARGPPRLTAGSNCSFYCDDQGALHAWGKRDVGCVDLGPTARAVSTATYRDWSLVLLADGSVVGRGRGGAIDGIEEALACRLVSAVACGEVHGMALLRTGEVVCWGIGRNGQVTGMEAALQGRPAVSIAASHAASFALLASGEVVGWGDKEETKGLDKAMRGRKAVQISAGTSWGGALCDNGRVSVWGKEKEGLESAVADRKLKSVAFGNSFALALGTDGTIKCWGKSSFGDESIEQLNRAAAAALQGRKAVAVAAGTNHYLALCRGGGVVAFGLKVEAADVPEHLRPRASAAASSGNVAVFDFKKAKPPGPPAEWKYAPGCSKETCRQKLMEPR